MSVPDRPTDQYVVPETQEFLVPAVAHQSLTVRAHGKSDRGKVRKGNEDAFLVATLQRALTIHQSSLTQPGHLASSPLGHLFVVADGVGGHRGGQHASALAINSIENFLLHTFNWCAQLKADGADSLLGEFRKALAQADERVFDETARQPELRGMATTMTLAYCHGSELFLAHAGDSRAYLMRNNLFYQMTRDHTIVDDLVRRGIMTAREAASHTFRHVITNVLGGQDPGVEVDLHKVPLEPGDCLLLCSDGLSEMVHNDDMQTVLTADRDPAQNCEKLVQLANDNGGRDNITAIVARFEA